MEYVVTCLDTKALRNYPIHKCVNELSININLDTKGGSYGNKILYKNLKFFDKIFVPSKIS